MSKKKKKKERKKESICVQSAKEKRKKTQKVEWVKFYIIARKKNSKELSFWKSESKFSK